MGAGMGEQKQLSDIALQSREDAKPEKTLCAFAPSRLCVRNAAATGPAFGFVRKQIANASGWLRLPRIFLYRAPPPF